MPPKILKARTVLAYTTSTGLSMEQGGQGRTIADAEAHLVEHVDEIARIAEIAGFGQRIVDAAIDAVARVQADRAKGLIE